MNAGLPPPPPPSSGVHNSEHVVLTQKHYDVTVHLGNKCGPPEEKKKCRVRNFQDNAPYFYTVIFLEISERRFGGSQERPGAQRHASLIRFVAGRHVSRRVVSSAYFSPRGLARSCQQEPTRQTQPRHTLRAAQERKSPATPRTRIKKFTSCVLVQRLRTQSRTIALAIVLYLDCGGCPLIRYHCCYVTLLPPLLTLLLAVRPYTAATRRGGWGGATALACVWLTMKPCQVNR